MADVDWNKIAEEGQKEYARLREECDHRGKLLDRDQHGWQCCFCKRTLLQGDVLVLLVDMMNWQNQPCRYQPSLSPPEGRVAVAVATKCPRFGSHGYFAGESCPVCQGRLEVLREVRYIRRALLAAAFAAGGLAGFLLSRAFGG